MRFFGAHWACHNARSCWFACVPRPTPPLAPLPPTACSPHIRALNERISVGGEPIPDAAFDALVARHAAAIEAAAQREAAAGQALSHFEVLTALAFTHFQEQQVRLRGLPNQRNGMHMACLPAPSCRPSCSGSTNAHGLPTNQPTAARPP